MSKFSKIGKLFIKNIMKRFPSRLAIIAILLLLAISHFTVGNSFALDTAPLLGTATVSNTSNLIYFTSATYNANVVISDPDPTNSNIRTISGYAWSVDLGWIEFTDNTTLGVYVDYNTGGVSGSAYVLNTGNLLDFDNYQSNVVFDDGTGMFSGFVWSQDVGWVDLGGVNMQDIIAPTGSVEINSGEAYTAVTAVDLTISATDSGSGISQMMICNTSDFSGCVWESYSTSKSWTLTNGEGTKTVYAKFKDVLDNESISYSDNITVDSTVPVGSVTVNPGATTTTSKTVNLTLSATDSASGVAQMMVCNISNFSGCVWESYSTSKSWTLTDGDGDKTVYAKFKDGSSNESTSYSDNITLDSIAPVGSVTINSGATATTSKTVNLTISATDSGSGVAQMMICNTSDFSGCVWESYATSKSWTLTDGYGIKTVYLKFKDTAGLVSSAYSDAIEVSAPLVVSSPPVIVSEEESEVVVEEETVIEEETVNIQEEVVEEEGEEETEQVEETVYETEIKQVAGVTEYSELKVRVKDDYGEPLANIPVKMADQTQLTDLGGIATFRNIKAGEYNLEYKHEGKDIVRGISVKNLDAEDGERVAVNIIEIAPEIEEKNNNTVYIVIFSGLLLLFVSVLLLRKKK